VFISVTDILFRTTSVFYKAQFFLFFFGFMCPFICQIFYCEQPSTVRLTVTVCMITQILFFLLEVVQMFIKGSRYFEFWNLVDCVLFAVFIVYYITRMANTDPLLPRWGTDEGAGVSEMTRYAVTHSVILIFSSLKLLNFLRVFEDFGQFVELLGQVMKDVSVFTMFFFYWVGLNSFMFDIMGVDYSNDDYDHVGRSFYYFLQTFRNALGDIEVPVYTSFWCQHAAGPDPNPQAVFMIYFIWVMWVGMQVFLSIILLNFLIAIISQSYEEVMNQSVISKLKQKCELNEETFGFINFFRSYQSSEAWYLSKFNVDNSGIFIVSTSYSQTVNSQWTGFVAKIQKTVKEEVRAVKESILAGVKLEMDELKKIIKA
jgi:hypothetical protein